MHGGGAHRSEVAGLIPGSSSPFGSLLPAETIRNFGVGRHARARRENCLSASSLREKAADGALTELSTKPRSRLAGRVDRQYKCAVATRLSSRHRTSISAFMGPAPCFARIRLGGGLLLLNFRHKNEGDSGMGSYEAESGPSDESSARGAPGSQRPAGRWCKARGRDTDYWQRQCRPSSIATARCCICFFVTRRRSSRKWRRQRCAIGTIIWTSSSVDGYC